jgi:UDP-N-acetyl-D-glucosamine dehydrogenase
VPEIPPTREHADYTGRKSVTLSAEVLEGFDAVLISTDHDAVDYVMIHDYAQLVVDTRNVMARHGLSGKSIVKA